MERLTKQNLQNTILKPLVVRNENQWFYDYFLMVANYWAIDLQSVAQLLHSLAHITQWSSLNIAHSVAH